MRNATTEALRPSGRCRTPLVLIAQGTPAAVGGWALSGAAGGGYSTGQLTAPRVSATAAAMAAPMVPVCLLTSWGLRGTDLGSRSSPSVADGAGGRPASDGVGAIVAFEGFLPRAGAPGHGFAGQTATPREAPLLPAVPRSAMSSGLSTRRGITEHRKEQDRTSRTFLLPFAPSAPKE